MSFTQTLNAREFEKKRSFEFLWELIEDWKSLWNYYSYPDNPLYVIFVFDKNICENWEISKEDSPNLFKKALASHFQTKDPLPDDFECPWYTKEELTHSAIVVSKAWLEEDKTWTNIQVIDILNNTTCIPLPNWQFKITQELSREELLTLMHNDIPKEKDLQYIKEYSTLFENIPQEFLEEATEIANEILKIYIQTNEEHSSRCHNLYFIDPNWPNDLWISNDFSWLLNLQSSVINTYTKIKANQNYQANDFEKTEWFYDLALLKIRYEALVENINNKKQKVPS